MKIKYLIAFLSFLGAYTEGGAQNTDTDSEQGHLSAFYEKSIINYAQSPIDTYRFDRVGVQRLQANIQYKPEEKKEPKPRRNRDMDMPNWRLPESVLPGFLMLLAALIIGTLVYFFGKDIVLRRNDRLQATLEIDFDALEENLDRSDVKSVLSKALNAQEWAMAVRLYYLLVLQRLNEAGAIQWKKDKTNRFYKSEMASHPLSQDFLDLTTTFEEVWYSEKALLKDDFLDIEVRFKRFFAALKA